MLSDPFDLFSLMAWLSDIKNRGRRYIARLEQIFSFRRVIIHSPKLIQVCDNVRFSKVIDFVFLNLYIRSCSICCKVFKMCLTILGHYTLCLKITQFKIDLKQVSDGIM